MNHLLNITQKELRELMTPGTIASMLIVVVMFAALGTVIGGQVEESGASPEIGVVYDGYDESYTADDYTAWLSTMTDDDSSTVPSFSSAKDVMSLVLLSYMAYYGTASVEDAMSAIHYLDNVSADDPDAITSAVSDGDLRYAISIDSSILDNVAGIESNYNTSSAAQYQSEIGTYFCYVDEGLFSSVSASTGVGLVSQMNTYLSEVILLNIGTTDISDVISPLTWGGEHTYTEINGTVYTDVTPYEISSSLSSQTLMIPIVITIVIVMVGSVVISSMGSEKENKTLETLLTMPIKRTTIVSGKLLAAAIMGVVYGIAYMIGMMFYTDGLMTGSAEVNLADYGLSMDVGDWLILMLILFLSIFCALAVCMILGAFTKNYKMAQTMTLPISLLAMIPMFVFMFMSWDSLPAAVQALMFAIPFSHPMMAMSNLMFGNTALILGGIVYLIVLDAVLVWLTVKVYNSDVLITGFDRNGLVAKLNKAFGGSGDGDEGDN